MSKYNMLREETGGSLAVSSSYICSLTHSSSALPTRFSLSCRRWEFKLPLRGAQGLLRCRLQGFLQTLLCKRDGSKNTEALHLSALS